MQPIRCVLVTGASGFVGRHLLPHLRRHFPQARLIAAARPDEFGLPSISGADLVLPFDLSSSPLDAIIADTQPDSLIHLASQASVADSLSSPLEAWQSNLMGTVRLGEATLRFAPHCRFVLASSAEVYGLSFRSGAALDESALLHPANPYAAAKAAADLVIGELSLRGLNAVRLRAFNHTGPGQSEKFVVSHFARQIARMEAGQEHLVMRVGALDRWRDYLDVNDVCEAYVACLLNDTPPGSIYNIASGQPRRIGDILEFLLSHCDIKLQIETETSRLRGNDLEYVVGNSALAAQALRWIPKIRWEETLMSVLHDWRARVAAQTG